MSDMLAEFLLGVFLGTMFGFCAALDLDRHASPRRMELLLRLWNKRAERKQEEVNAIRARLARR